MTKPSICPDFLIIGAMKAGTTTLYRDLEQHPDIFLPQEKEPETLIRLGDDDDRIRADYRSLFRGAGDNQIKGEASTGYTKRPTHEGAAARALRVCGSDLKLIYLMRDPVARMVSHYRHEYGLHETELGLHDAFAQEARYFDYGRYAYQMEPWLACFPVRNFLFLSFEDYVADRSATLRTVCSFLGVDPETLPKPEEDVAFNKSTDKPVALGLAGRFVRSGLYQRGLKRIIPRTFREAAMGALLPKARKAEERLDDAARADLISRFAAEPPAPGPVANSRSSRSSTFGTLG